MFNLEDRIMVIDGTYCAFRIQSDVTWPSWRLISAVTSNGSFKSLSRLTYAKGSHYWSFLRRINWLQVDSPHRALVTWKEFPFHVVAMGITKISNSPHKGPVMQSHDIFVDYRVSIDYVLNKQSMYRWFETPKHSDYITAMNSIESTSSSQIT